MQKQDCRMLISVYEEKNLTKAAQKLFTSQPAITYRLQKLEEEYQIKLYNRQGNKLFFTPEGEYLVEFSKRMLLDLDKLEENLKTIKKDATGTIRIGVSSNFALYKLPTLIKQFLDLPYNIQVNVTTGWSSEIIQLLNKNEIQIGIITGNYNWFDEKILLAEDPLTIVSKNPIKLEEIPFMPLISYQPNKKKGPGEKATNPLAQMIENWWQDRFSAPPLVRMELDSVETCKEMVNQSLGYSIIPKSCLTDKDSFFTHDLINDKGKPLNRKTWLIFRKSNLELLTVSHFVEFVEEQLKNDQS
ncbi:LysR family transcriptional regulator [Sporosarcina sp.]|uniref:LysR family transcriptional regulator n=1 Tax=Sporosarcina sp. TaxID=49982 RepID=UPI00260C5A96|nr:LysR family transcriptional regulator [Sporosarcina sp.]